VSRPCSPPAGPKTRRPTSRGPGPSYQRTPIGLAAIDPNEQRIRYVDGRAMANSRRLVRCVPTPAAASDRTLSPRPRSRNSPARGVRRPQPFHEACEGAGMTWAGPIWPPSTQRNILAGLEQRHYAPSRVTVKLGDRCGDRCWGSVSGRAGPDLSPLVVHWHTEDLSELRRWLARRAEAEMVQDPADRDGVGDVGNDLEGATAASAADRTATAPTARPYVWRASAGGSRR